MTICQSNNQQLLQFAKRDISFDIKKHICIDMAKTMKTHYAFVYQLAFNMFYYIHIKKSFLWQFLSMQEKEQKI